MKRKYILVISILILAILFGTAATCNMCGLSITPTASTETLAGSETSAETSSETIAEITKDTTESSVSASATETSKETTSKETASATNQTEIPTIKLQIYEGPTAATGDVCYYRVEATVTGSPAPQVTFSKDDSGGAFGSEKVQVNLTESSPNYTLTAKAKNSAGEANASINLSWGCGPLAVEKTLVLNPSILGTVGPSGFVAPGVIIIADSEFNTDWRGRFAFDVSALAGKDIQSAKLKLSANSISNPPCDFRGDIVIFYNDFLPGLTASDYTSAGYAGPQSFAWNANPLEFSTDFLRDKVKERADSGVEIQFGIGYAILASDLDGTPEGISYISDSTTLTVTYLE